MGRKIENQQAKINETADQLTEAALSSENIATEQKKQAAEKISSFLAKALLSKHLYGDFTTILRREKDQGIP